MDNDIGRYLKARREALALSQQVVACKSDLTASQLSRIESGETQRHTLDVYQRIAGALNLDTAHIAPSPDRWKHCTGSIASKLLAMELGTHRTAEFVFEEVAKVLPEALQISMHVSPNGLPVSSLRLFIHHSEGTPSTAVDEKIRDQTWAELQSGRWKALSRNDVPAFYGPFLRDWDKREPTVSHDPEWATCDLYPLTVACYPSEYVNIGIRLPGHRVLIPEIVEIAQVVSSYIRARYTAKRINTNTENRLRRLEVAVGVTS